jgi:hypothetical protein
VANLLLDLGQVFFVLHEFDDEQAAPVGGASYRHLPVIPLHVALQKVKG